MTQTEEKHQLLFYDAYEEFYTMAEVSPAFRDFCTDAFGADFSQDGFSNLAQIEQILPHIPTGAHILDIGCGNGKMLGFLQQKTGTSIHGFDYSETAIHTARRLFPDQSDFQVGIIGQIEYPANSFDVIVSMDSMYFAKDMTAFTAQIKTWLKPDGIFFCGYQEGDVIPKTPNVKTTLLAQALTANGMSYEVCDITEQVYTLLKKKRRAALAHRTAFEKERQERWFELLLAQTEISELPYEQFKAQMARYLFVAKKNCTQ